jgi:hypothetical protein
MNVYRNVSEANILEPMYDKWLTTSHIQGQFRDYSYYHPSDLGYCIRKSVMMKLGYDGEFYTLPRLQRIFENGHGTHARYQEHFSKMGIIMGRWECSNCHFVLGKETKLGITRPSDCPNCHNPRTKTVTDNKGNIVFGPYPLFEYKELPVISDNLCGVKGHTDGVVNINGTLHVVDFKTCSQSGFTEVTSRNYPMEAHVFQINIYMYILGVDRGILLYENRNDLRMREFLLFKDNEIMAEVVKRIIMGEKAIKEGCIPDIPANLTPQSFSCCGYPGCPPCPFYHYCFPEQAAMAKQYESKYKEFIKTSHAIDEDD